jgi:hypothetical protein
MNILKAICVTAVAAGSVLLATQPAFSRDRGPTARSLDEVGTIRVEGNLCPSRVSSKLTEHGFMASPALSGADAVLELDVATNGHLSDQESMDEGRYVATLIGARNRVLFSTAGSEESLNLGLLCNDIGEEIADDLESVS